MNKRRNNLPSISNGSPPREPTNLPIGDFYANHNVERFRFHKWVPKMVVIDFSSECMYVRERGCEIHICFIQFILLGVFEVLSK